MTRKRIVLTVGDRIRKARENKGLSQWELATRAGIRPETVSHLECNRRQAALGSLWKLAPVLGVKMEWLLNGK